MIIGHCKRGLSHSLLTVVCWGLFSFQTVQAQVQIQIEKRIRLGNVALGVGSHVKMQFTSKRATADGLFLGRVVESDGQSDELLFLDTHKTRAYLIDRTQVRFAPQAGKMQVVLRPMPQQGNSCAAYAFTHFWQQFALAGVGGNMDLAAMMSSERTRLQFFEENMSRYYLDNRINVVSIMKDFGKRFGVRCQTKVFSNGDLAADFIFENSRQGYPVLIDFFIGPNMVTSTYETVDFEKPGPVDSRLWVPRRRGERNSGGHMIVAAAAFEVRGRRKVVVVDSNWDQPRIWDVDRYLGGKTAVKEMTFSTCRP